MGRTHGTAFIAGRPRELRSSTARFNDMPITASELHAAEALAHALEGAGISVAVAESLTAGRLAEALVSVEGSSEWFEGGVVAYDGHVKREVLGVAPGPVISEPAVKQMAVGVAELLGADLAIATSGCAGPTTMEGQPVGAVWLGWSFHGDPCAGFAMFRGSPEEIRARTVAHALSGAAEIVRSSPRRASG
jgi:PncC family amidohydrolase